MKEPHWLAEQRKIVESWPPKVCWTCEFYTAGLCTLHDARPPAEFAETPDACPDWSMEIPL